MGKRVPVDETAVVRVALEAIDTGLPVRATVAEVLDLSMSQAAYYVRKAREAGKVPPHASPDAHLPTTAVIHRGSSREKTWSVCQVCLTPQCEL